MSKRKSKKGKSLRWVQGTVCFDFDGVLSKGSDYHWPTDELDLSLITEAHERGYAVAVMTCNDVHRVADELRKHGLRVHPDPYMYRASWHDPERVLVTGRKITATAYVDDRAISYRFGQPVSAVFDAVEGLQGYKACPLGRHWGTHGAAGVLPWTSFRGQLYVLLGQRSWLVQTGGTWSAFGGALDEGEDAWKAAQRELHEEVSGLDYCMSDWSDYYVHQCPSCGWKYTTFLSEVLAVDPEEDRSAWLPEVRTGDWETRKLRWVRVSDVENYDLHPGFAEAWPALRKSLERAAAGEAA